MSINQPNKTDNFLSKLKKEIWLTFSAEVKKRNMDSLPHKIKKKLTAN